MNCRQAITLLLVLIVSSLQVASGQYKSLTFDDYDHWKRLSSSSLSSAASFMSYEVKPITGFGDVRTVLTNLNTMDADTLERTEGLKFATNEQFYAFKARVPYDTLKALKLKKTPAKKLPKDTLKVVSLALDSTFIYPKYSGFRFTEHASNWMMIEFDEYAEKKSEGVDEKKKKRKKKKRKKKGDNKPAKKKSKKHKTHAVVLLNPVSGDEVVFQHVKNQRLSDDGKSLFYTAEYGTDADTSAAIVYNVERGQPDTIYIAKGVMDNPKISRTGEHFLFFHSADTTKVKNYSLYMSRGEEAFVLVDSSSSGVISGKVPNNKAQVSFSRDLSRVFFEVIDKRIEPEKDSLLKTETAKLDVWSWKDERLQPQQLLSKSRDEKAGLGAVVLLNNGNKIIQLEQSRNESVRIGDKRNATWGVLVDNSKHAISYSWSFPWLSDYYAINIETGERKLLKSEVGFSNSMSPSGEYFAWYDGGNDTWYCKHRDSAQAVNISAQVKEDGLVFYNEAGQTPSEPNAYGIEGWSEDEQHVIVNTNRDVYAIQVDGKGAKNLTNGLGKSGNTRYNRMRFTRESTHINLDSASVFSAFNYTDNSTGYVHVEGGVVDTLVWRDAAFVYFAKADSVNQYIVRSSTYERYPDYALVTDLKAWKELPLSNLQKQREGYNWGTVEKYYWNAFDGTKLKGLLYKPYDFDPNKEYPLMVYFYEKNFNTEHSARSFRPSPSTVSVPFYVSNDYLVFIPDIEYGTGYPGRDAYNCIVSGAESLAKMPFVDGDRMAIQGQSWGGYQVAYLVTQTDVFAAGMAGAPVSNMISAYGGIRWGSGMSRMFQYERTQSRIGGPLWENWSKYRDNSPIYHLQNVETPLLIMHNDKDGAVPWYQGIEMMVGLRRLQKPAWMLNYNGDQHNLMRIANRIDLSKRMFGFFNHYLKGEPMPRWMEEGVPALVKGKENRY